MHASTSARRQGRDPERRRENPASGDAYSLSVPNDQPQTACDVAGRGCHPGKQTDTSEPTNIDANRAARRNEKMIFGEKRSRSCRGQCVDSRERRRTRNAEKPIEYKSISEQDAGMRWLSLHIVLAKTMFGNSGAVFTLCQFPISSCTINR